jgi:hypothetical protein
MRWHQESHASAHMEQGPDGDLRMQAAILTGRRGKSAITLSEIDDSVDRIVAGMEGTPMTDGKSKSLVAYHEVGHAVCGTLTPGHDQVQKVGDHSSPAWPIDLHTNFMSPSPPALCGLASSDEPAQVCAVEPSRAQLVGSPCTQSACADTRVNCTCR